MSNGTQGAAMAKRTQWLGMTAMVVLGLAAMAASAQGTDVQPLRYRVAAVPMAAAQQGNNEASNIKDDLFQGTEVFAKNATGVTEINMGPDSLDMVGGGDDGHKAHNMILNVVRTYSYDKPGMYNMADVDAYRNKLNTGDWHCSVHVRELKTGESTDVCSKHRTDGLKETAIISVEPKELTFIHTIRRAGGPGSSDLSMMPLFPGMGSLPMMAMLNPELFAELQIGMHAMPMVTLPEMRLELDQAGRQMQLAMPKMQMQMKDFQKLKELHPMDKKQMEKLQKQLKNLKVQPLPELPEQPEQMEKPEQPEAPEAPAAPEAPEAPKP
jgi:hypothetical protein